MIELDNRLDDNMSNRTEYIMIIHSTANRQQGRLKAKQTIISISSKHLTTLDCAHNKFGDRSFSAAGPQQWNDLPPELRRPDLSFPMFRQKLKSLLFDRST